jgi:hypothetical protein
MGIIARQDVATFSVRRGGAPSKSIQDGDLCLWQPEDTRCWNHERDPWTPTMVNALWTKMIQEGSDEMDRLKQEIVGWEDLDKLARGPVDTAPEIDIDEPSYFNYWDQSTDLSCLVRNGRGEAQMFTPEMLVQQDNLNDMWNANCQLEDENRSGGQIWDRRPGDVGEVPDIHSTLEFVSVGAKFGVAKCEYGSVYVPKSALKHIQNLLDYEESKPDVGQRFGAWISFAGYSAKYPWRIEVNVGVTELY